MPQSRVKRHTVTQLTQLLLAAVTISTLIVPRSLTAMVPAKPVTVYAAASLTAVLQVLGPRFTAETGVPVTFSFAASSQLARQIESGAPAEVFVSADEAWMDYLEQRHLIQASSRTDVAGNRLVLIAAANSTLSLKISPHFQLLEAIGTGRLSIGDPLSVPIGRYAKAALTSLGVWVQVADHVLPAENARSALMYVERGEAPLGIVYETDAQSARGVRIIGTFPASTHPPIRYPAALTQQASANANRWLHYLQSTDAAHVFQAQGFIAP